ncbi:lipopolysaccharide biosynthesis protein [Stieleria neptunia]|uniref:lipopolysaccharide biosynthesis protein n=1 Tax=Stieleria neptunia TaxID=2527979 RepID=UPI0018D2479D|nr:polysaccharide biosynthesis C-terminal domain-containing protein [Stieleria neptunia]
MTALLDQFFVSGTSFLSTIVVGRYCGIEGLGLFSLAVSAIVLVRGIQETLVSAPFTVFQERLRDRMTSQEHAGGALAGAMILAAITVILTSWLALGLAVTGQPLGIRVLAYALIACAPLALLREFSRRFCMARRNMIGALRIDASVCLLQLGCLLALAWQGRLTSVAALWVIGLSSGVVSLAWWYGQRKQFVLHRTTIRTVLHHDWRFGRWLLMDQLVCFMQLYAMHWILAGMIGASGTGAFAACATIAALASPLLQGVGNYLSPQFANAAFRGSRAEVVSLYRKTTASLAIAVTLFAALAGWFGREILSLLYSDSAYDAYGPVVGVLAFRTVFAIPALAAHHAVVAMERPGRSAAATAIGLVATLCIALPLIQHYGVLGAAVAVFIGTGVECLVLVTIFTRLLGQWNWSDESSEKT